MRNCVAATRARHLTAINVYEKPFDTLRFTSPTHFEYNNIIDDLKNL